MIFTVKPRIDRTNLQNLVMKVGHTKLIDVNISGEPVPTVTWTFKDNVSNYKVVFISDYKWHINLHRHTHIYFFSNKICVVYVMNMA